MSLKWEVIRHIATLDETSEQSLELNVVQWNKWNPKYDLRLWKDGKPTKGVTLTEDNLRDLFNAIGEELNLFEEEENYEDLEDEDFEDDDEENDDDGENDDVEDEEYIPYRNFFIHGNGECAIYGHDDQEPVTAVIQISCRNGAVEDMEVDASYCPDCNAYYISEQDYRCLTLLGRPICFCMTEEEYDKYKGRREYSDLNPESIFHILGYNTNAQDNLSDAQRQDILSFVIESGLSTKKRAVSHLDWCIRMRASDTRQRLAIEKYRRDIAFLNGYEPGKIQRFRPGILIIHGEP